MLIAYKHVARSGAQHLRCKQTTYSDTLKEKLRRVGSPANWIQVEQAWDFPMSAASIIALDAVSKEVGEQVQWEDGLQEFAEQHVKQSELEHQTRLAIERMIRDPSIPLEQYPCITVDPATGQACPPTRYQQILWSWSQRTSGILMAWDPGCGKTRGAADAAGGWYRSGLIPPMTPTFVEGKPAVEGGVLIICPKTVMRTWSRELTTWQNATGLIIYGTSEKKTRLAGVPSHFHIINYESLSYVVHNRYAGLIIDECFVEGTLVWGERGPVPIQEVRRGDKVWSYNHDTGLVELRTVSYVFVNAAKSRLVEVKTSQGAFICTENHPFYTRRGYVPAAALTIQDEVFLGGRDASNSGNQDVAFLRDMQKAISSAEKRTEGVQSVVCRTLAEEAAQDSHFQPRSHVPGVRGPLLAQEQVQAIEVLQRPMHGSILRTKAGEVEHVVLLGAYAEEQPHAHAGGPRESYGDPSSNRAQTVSSRWKWPGTHCVGSQVMPCVESEGLWLGDKPRGENPERVSSGSLQVGCGAPGVSRSDRSGRGNARIQTHAVPRRAEGPVVTWAPVESVTLQKSRDRRGATASGRDSSTTVYNLEVEGNNNYFVGKVPHLVHNCHRVSNRTNQTERTLAIAQRTTRRLGLSGTPMSNSLQSLWYPMFIIDQGKSLGASRTAFLEKYFTSHMVGPGIVDYDPKEHALEEISAAIAKSTYFVKKEEVLKDLPSKTHTPFILEMTPDQAKYYKQIKDEAVAYIQDTTATVETIQAKLQKLMQICQGFVLTDDGENPGRHFSNSKMETLMEWLTGEMAGRKVIVWAYFRYEIKVIVDLLREKGIKHVRIDGSITSQRARDEAVDRWNSDPTLHVFVRQLAMSEGLTLLAKDCEVPCYESIFCGLSYVYRDWLQAQDRIHRIGQKFPVSYRYLLTENGYDRKVYDSCLDKSNLAGMLQMQSKDHYLKLLRD